MRRNAFNEVYCHTAEEVQSVLDDHDGRVYVPRIERGEAEVADNVTGETVLYIEGAHVQEIIHELDLEVS